MLPYIYDDVKELVRNVLQLFAKYEVKRAKQHRHVNKLIYQISHILSKSGLNIGNATDITIAEMKQKAMVTKSQIDSLKQECLLFLLATIRKLSVKTKLGSSIMRYASCLNCSHLTTLASS